MIPVQVGADERMVVDGVMLVDTGSNVTILDTEVAANLNLPEVSKSAIHTFDDGKETAASYRRALLVIPRVAEAGIAIDVLCSDCSRIHVGSGLPGGATRVIGILGRDVLRHCLLVYDGKAGTILLNFDVGG